MLIEKNPHEKYEVSLNESEEEIEREHCKVFLCECVSVYVGV